MLEFLGQHELKLRQVTLLSEQHPFSRKRFLQIGGQRAEMPLLFARIALAGSPHAEPVLSIQCRAAHGSDSVDPDTTST